MIIVWYRSSWWLTDKTIAYPFKSMESAKRVYDRYKAGEEISGIFASQRVADLPEFEEWIIGGIPSL